MVSTLLQPAKPAKRVGRKVDYIRWTIAKATLEFGPNEDTISKRLKAAGITPGPDDCYSTKQIATAVYGDLERERIRLTSAEADAQERENLVEAGKLVEVDEFVKEYAKTAVEMVRLIRGSSLNEAEQDKLLKQLSDVQV